MAASGTISAPPPRRRWVREGVGALGPLLPGVLVAGVGVFFGLLAVGVQGMPANLRPLLIMAAVLPFAAMVIGDLRLPLLAAIAVDVTLDRDINVGYRFDAADLGAIGGISVSVTTMALLGLWSLKLLEVTEGRRQWGDVRRIAVPLASYIGVVAVSALVAADRGLALNEIWLLLQTFALFMYLALFLRSRADVLFVLCAVIVGVALQGMLVFLPGLAESLTAGAGERSLDGGNRFSGTMRSPNLTGGVLSLFLVPAAALLLTPVAMRYKLIGSVGFLLGAIGLVATFSRGGWLAFIFAVVAFAALGVRRGWLGGRSLAVLAALLLAVTLPLGALISQRLTADDNGAAQSRFPMMEIASRIASDHPLLGVGANNYTVVLPAYRTPDVSATWNFTVHNKYLLVLAENGPLGLVAFVGFLLATIGVGLRAARSRDPVLSVIAGALAVSIAGQMLHMNVDIFHARPTVQSLWLVAGLLAAISRLARPGVDVEARRRALPQTARR